MKKIKIVGISGSPVKDGNCDKLVQRALESAKEVGGEIDTEFITLAGKEIACCTHCQYCIENQTYCKIQDDAQAIWQKMKEADGIIWGAPTWLRTVAPPILVLMSRCRYQLFFGFDFRNKVMGALTLGWFGTGMDIATLELMHVASRAMMIPVAEGMAISSAVAIGKRAEQMEHGVLDDKRGVISVENVGYRVAEISRMIKYATDAGIVVPPEYQITTSGGTVKRRGKK